VLFGVIDQGGAAQAIATIPEFVWELSLGIYLIAKGFKASPLTTGNNGHGHLAVDEGLRTPVGLAR
jgi:hypothetical protein